MGYTDRIRDYSEGKIELTETGRRKCLNGSSHSVDLATMGKMYLLQRHRMRRIVLFLLQMLVDYTWSNAQRWTEGTTKSRLGGVLTGFPIGWTDINGQLD
ncbi:hypothetical protein P7H22_26100 [Paenibacillus larvae]|nr:hypothetical protein [Paenibacillus larvae]MDT2243106.1 hypothetical protein [Paenibacillus larvae]